MNTLVSYPRASLAAAHQRMEQLSTVSPVDAGDLVSFDTSRATWHHVSEHVSEAVLVRFREGVVGIAKQHSYPYSPHQDAQADDQGRELGFDEDLTDAILDLLPGMTPSEAGHVNVWRFLTLWVVPDVAIWRWPIPVSREGNPKLDFERLTGRRRNFLRHAWTRAYLLSPELNRRLKEDEREGIVGRPTVLGSPRVARAFAEAALEFAHTQQGSRRELMRESMKRLLRASGRVSLYALDDAHLQDVVRQTIEQVPPVEESPMEGFLRACSDRGIDIEPALRITLPDDAQLQRIALAVDEYAASFPEEETLSRIRAGSRALLERWTHLTNAGRQVALASILYFLRADDRFHDSQSGGLEDDLSVVNAALAATGLNFAHSDAASN